MTEKRIVRLAGPLQRRTAHQYIDDAPDGFVMRLSPPTRSLESNAALWAMLNDISKQVCWHGRMLDSESWKHIFSSSMKKQDVVPNLDGTGFVVMGISTSKMTKHEMSDLLEIISAFGAQRGVVWSDEARK